MRTSASVKVVIVYYIQTYTYIYVYVYVGYRDIEVKSWEEIPDDI